MEPETPPSVRCSGFLGPFDPEELQTVLWGLWRVSAPISSFQNNRAAGPQHVLPRATGL